MHYPSTFETNCRCQVHHSYIWLAPIAATFAVAVAVLIGNARGTFQLAKEIEQDTGWGLEALIGIVLATLVVLYGIIVALHAVAYRFLFYEFGEGEFSLYSGIITKRHVHVPYARVQSVNHHASLLQRIFGVCTVSIDTAGGASNKAVRVPYVQLETAERIRRELFARKAAAAAGVAVVYEPQAGRMTGGIAGALDTAAVRGQAPLSPDQLAQQYAQDGGSPNLLEDALGDVGTWRGAFGGEEVGMEPVAYEFGLANKELLLTGFSHAAAVSSAAVLGVIGLVTGALLALPEAEVTEISGYGMVGGSIALAVLFIVVGWVIGVLGICIQYGGFRARRRGSRIEVERGLLQREYSGLDIERVQSVVVRQSFIRRCLGYCEISLGRIDAGGDDRGSNSNSSKLDRHGLVIHPFVKMDKVDEVLSGLLPEFNDRPVSVDLKKLPPVALRRAITRRCIWFNGILWTAVAIVVARQLFLLIGTANDPAFGSSSGIADMVALFGLFCIAAILIAAVATVLHAISAILWHRGSGFAFNNTYTAMRNDGLHTEYSLFPRTKIQCGFTRSNPFQRHARVTGVTMVSAAGTSSTRVRLLDVREEDGVAWLEWLLPRDCAVEPSDHVCEMNAPTRMEEGEPSKI